MNRVQQNQLKDILIQLTMLEKSLTELHWDVGETITTEKSITIQKAATNLKNAIENLTGVI